MNLREYQAKKIFAQHGIAIPRGEIATTAEQVQNIALKLKSPVVLKPQLGIKKRGKLGIISFAENPKEAYRQANHLFNRVIKDEQIKTILVEEKVNIARELYLAVTVDYSNRCPVLIISQQGGIEIETIAQQAPQQLLKIPVNILTGPSAEDWRKISRFIGEPIEKYMRILYSLFEKYDAEMIEINPLIKTEENNLIAVDAVLNINDDSLFRQPEILALRQEIATNDPIAEEARQNNWTYIDLPGDIAILSSGAGLTMTILDLINYAGGTAANFLDTAQIDDEGIYRAFELLTKAKKTRAMLVNIFAGLNRCDRLAMGIQKYLQQHPLDIPIIIRMVGNKEEIGHQILRDIGIEPYKNLEAAIERVVNLSHAGK